MIQDLSIWHYLAIWMDIFDLVEYTVPYSNHFQDAPGIWFPPGQAVFEACSEQAACRSFGSPWLHLLFRRWNDGSSAFQDRHF